MVDATDRLRVHDCQRELAGLLLEEVRGSLPCRLATFDDAQRLMGATLLVFANKTDIAGSMSDEEVQQVSRVEERV